MSGPSVARLTDGRLHLHHGPIDLILQAWGDPRAVTEGERQAVARFSTILAELAAELRILRSEGGKPQGPVACRMALATAPFAPRFITPMAAVAGAVADAILAELAVAGVSRAYVNNGGDIAVHLGEGQSLTCAIATPDGRHNSLTLRAGDPVRGIATSGWRGRSWSLGIADSVTVLARTAAMADAAATMIANEVNLAEHPGIIRRPAQDLQSDSDLGTRLVTTGVSGLSHEEISRALSGGETAAISFRNRGLLEAAALFLHPQTRIVGTMSLKEPAVV